MMWFYLAWVLILVVGALWGYGRWKKRYLETPLPLQIQSSRPYGERLFSITLQHRDGCRLPRGTSGSHIVITVAHPGGVARRAYSLMGSTPHAYEIAVAMQPGGKVSGHLAHHLQPGTRVDALPPRGRFFKLHKTPQKAVCLMGAGVGISPLIPMAQDALRLGYTVHLLHAARHVDELIAFERLQSLAAAEPRLHYLPVVSRTAALAAPYCSGRIDTALLQHLGLRGYAGDVYVCGATGFTRAMVACTQALGCRGQVFEESFSGNDAYLPFQVTIGELSFPFGREPTLLAACEAHGVLPFAECRTGHCLNCRAQLTSGTVRWLTPSARPLPQGTILTCCCVPGSDVTLALPAAPRAAHTAVDAPQGRQGNQPR